MLFNGGLFESPVLRAAPARRAAQLVPSRRCRGKRQSAWQPIVLDNDRLDLAVARGAAYYGMVRRGQGVRIAAGLARTYYIGVETQGSERAEVARYGSPHPLHSTSPSAVCLVPAGVEPGHDVDLTQRRFDLLVSEPVEFPLYVSSTRLTDRPGELVPFDREQMTPLPPIRTVLRTRKKGEAETVSVNLHARLTEIGTLDLWCSEVDGPAELAAAVRRPLGHADRRGRPRVGRRERRLRRRGRPGRSAATADRRDTFGPDGHDKPEGLVKRLAAADRHEPQPVAHVALPADLGSADGGRGRAAPSGQIHEARWLNLLGFALRPGYGLAVDDWRVAETWRVVQGKLVHPTAACRAEGWILWRRIGGGLSAGQQQALAEPLLGPIRGLHRQLTTGKGRGGDFSFPPHETAEIWRLLGSLELLPVGDEDRAGRRCCSTCCRSGRWSRCGRRSSGPWAASAPACRSTAR